MLEAVKPDSVLIRQLEYVLNDLDTMLPVLKAVQTSFDAKKKRECANSNSRTMTFIERFPVGKVVSQNLTWGIF